MTTTPNDPDFTEPTEGEAPDLAEQAARSGGGPGAEVGLSEGESTFEPEEDPEGHGG